LLRLAQIASANIGVNAYVDGYDIVALRNIERIEQLREPMTSSGQN
jgi:hypothetical protein